MSTIRSSHFGSSFGRPLVSIPAVEWRELVAREAASLWRATLEAGKEARLLQEFVVNTVIGVSAAVGLIIAAWETNAFYILSFAGGMVELRLHDDNRKAGR